MAGQSLELNIKTTSDVPQAMDRAKESIASLEKRAASAKISPAATAVEQTTSKSTSNIESQFNKIGKSFGNTISSVFLSFAGPLAIISGIIALIGNAIAESQQLAKDGLSRIAEGRSKMASDEESRMAAFFKAKDEKEKEKREVEAGKAEMTRRFLSETAEGRRISATAMDPMAATAMQFDPAIQARALKAFLASPEGIKFKPIFDAEKSSKAKDIFKGPEGFSNVVGVGANPVLEAMQEALDVAKQQLVELQKISNKQVPDQVDFTKKTFNVKP